MTPPSPTGKRVRSARKRGPCEACGSRIYVSRHHLRPRAQGGSDSAENRCVLCRVCHARTHHLFGDGHQYCGPRTKLALLDTLRKASWSAPT